MRVPPGSTWSREAERWNVHDTCVAGPVEATTGSPAGGAPEVHGGRRAFALPLQEYAPNGYGFKVVGDTFCTFSVVSELLEVILAGSMH
eukprot:871229-Prymnesium_polylepis.1